MVLFSEELCPCLLRSAPLLLPPRSDYAGPSIRPRPPWWLGCAVGVRRPCAPYPSRMGGPRSDYASPSIRAYALPVQSTLFPVTGRRCLNGVRPHLTEAPSVRSIPTAVRHTETGVPVSGTPACRYGGGTDRAAALIRRRHRYGVGTAHNSDHAARLSAHAAFRVPCSPSVGSAPPDRLGPAAGAAVGGEGGVDGGGRRRRQRGGRRGPRQRPGPPGPAVCVCVSANARVRMCARVLVACVCASGCVREGVCECVCASACIRARVCECGYPRARAQVRASAAYTIPTLYTRLHRHADCHARAHQHADTRANTVGVYARVAVCGCARVRVLCTDKRRFARAFCNE